MLTNQSKSFGPLPTATKKIKDLTNQELKTEEAPLKPRATESLPRTSDSPFREEDDDNTNDEFDLNAII